MCCTHDLRETASETSLNQDILGLTSDLTTDDQHASLMGKLDDGYQQSRTYDFTHAFSAMKSNFATMISNLRWS